MAQQEKQIGRREFITLMALLMSLTALAIDAALPAFYVIQADFAVQNENHLQYIVSAVFLGMALGQIFYGPLSDSIGRKGPLAFGLVVFVSGTLISSFATSYEMLLVGRFVQGLGAAGSRTISTAFIRDGYSGREMAQIMSFVMMLFILVPALAPAFGQLILLVSTWHWIFLSTGLVGATAFVWLVWRQPESHPVDKRVRFSFAAILLAALEVLRNKTAAGYMVLAGLSFGGLIMYLNTAKLLFFDVYHVDELFAVYFGILAIALGCASYINARLVMRHGMRKMIRFSFWLMGGAAFLLVAFTLAFPITVPLWVFMVLMSAVFFSLGVIFSNSNALAMEPVGHIAGVATAVLGSGTTLISIIWGNVLGQFYDKTLLPMGLGFLALSLVCLVVQQRVDRA